MSGFNPDDYVDVAERITQFYETYPDGRLTTVDWDIKVDPTSGSFVWVHAKAYRTPDDPLPCDGIAWEPVPGPTQFTLNSELMNAQTAAWGRAIVALGFDTKKVASREEVQARQSNGATTSSGGATDKQKQMIRRLAAELKLQAVDVDSLTKAEASAKIEELLKAKELGAEAVAVGGSSDVDDIPFAPSEF